MQTIKEIISELGAHPVATITGAIGTLVAIVMNDNEFSFKRALAQALSGIAFAGWGTDWLINWLGWEEKTSLIGLVGLILGLCGISIAKGFTNLGKSFEKDPLSLIKKNKNDTDI